MTTHACPARSGPGRLLLALCAALLLAAWAVPSARAGDGLDIKPGLWQVTTTTTVRGSLLPPAMLEKLSPEARAKLQAEQRKIEAAGPQTQKSKSCVKPEDLTEGAFRPDDSREAGCKTTYLAQTRSVQEATTECKGDNPRTTRMRIEALGRDRMKAVLSATTPNGSMNAEMSGQWLAAACNDEDEDDDAQ
jgi:hypothetical protein